jgi:hypothetical protein
MQVQALLSSYEVRHCPARMSALSNMIDLPRSSLKGVPDMGATNKHSDPSEVPNTTLCLHHD